MAAHVCVSRHASAHSADQAAALARRDHYWLNEGGRFLWVIVRLAQNGYGRDVMALATTLCREAWEEHQTWAAIKDLPLGRRRRTRLMHAARVGNLARIAWLRARHADVRCADEDGCTALIHAAAAGQTAAVRALLTHVPLGLLRDWEREAVIVDAEDARGSTALEHARRGWHADVSRVLLAHGAAGPMARIMMRAIRPEVYAPRLAPQLLNIALHFEEEQAGVFVIPA